MSIGHSHTGGDNLALTIALLFLLQLVLLAAIIRLENDQPNNTITWLFGASLLPVIGFALYILFGQKQRSYLFKNKHQTNSGLRQPVDRQLNPESAGSALQGLDPSQAKLARLLLKAGRVPLSVHNRAEILVNGEETFTALLNSLENARQFIHISYFIFKKDEIGEDVRKILSRKAREGVQVRIILDGLGSVSIAGDFVKQMREAGIEVYWYFPLRFPYLTPKLNLRYHRKLVIVDGITGYLGGLNIGDEYLSRNPELGFWRDTHLKLSGEAVQTLQSIFLSDWHFVTKQTLNADCFFPHFQECGILPMQIGASGPDSASPAILQSFFSAITLAERSIQIVTPYFIPEQSLIAALKTAALSGIEVKLIIQGVPEHKLVFWAMNSYLEELLRSGVEIFQYMKGILHAKTLVVDEIIASIGSANLDQRSFFLDFEVCAFIYDRKIAKFLNDDFSRDLQECHRINPEEFLKRPFSNRAKEFFARLFSPLL